MQLDYDELAMANAEQHLYDIARSSDGRPFMSVVSLTHPHDPYYCTQPYWDLYEGVDIPPPAVAALPIDQQDPLTRYIMTRHELDDALMMRRSPARGAPISGRCPISIIRLAGWSICLRNCHSGTRR